MLGKVALFRECSFLAADAQLHLRDQTAEVLISRPGGDENRKTGFTMEIRRHGGILLLAFSVSVTLWRKRHFCADVGFDSRFLGGKMLTGRSVNAVAIEERQCGHPKSGACLNQGFRSGRAFQETEGRAGM